MTEARGLWDKLSAALREEVRGLDRHLLVVSVVNKLRPGLSPSARASLLRRLGSHLGTSTRFLGMPRLTGSNNPLGNLTSGADCVFGKDVVLDLEDRIELGNRVELGDGVMILTSSHELGPKEHRAGPLLRGPVVIEDGASIGAGAILCPNVVVGACAVVEPGAVVNRAVPAAARVRGNPAVPVPPSNEKQDGASRE